MGNFFKSTKSVQFNFKIFSNEKVLNSWDSKMNLRTVFLRLKIDILDLNIVFVYCLFCFIFVSFFVAACMSLVKYETQIK